MIKVEACNNNDYRKLVSECVARIVLIVYYMRVYRGPDQHRMRSHPTLRKCPLPRVTHCLHSRFLTQQPSRSDAHNVRCWLAADRAPTSLSYSRSRWAPHFHFVPLSFSLWKLMLSVSRSLPSYRRAGWSNAVRKLHINTIGQNQIRRRAPATASISIARTRFTLYHYSSSIHVSSRC